MTSGAISTRRLRVLHVIDSLHGSGGAENRLVDEVLALDDRFDQAVVRLYEADALDDRLVGGGVAVIPLGLRARDAARTWPWAAAKLWAVVRRWRPDVVHTSLFSANLVGQLAATARGVPVVSTFNRSGELYGPPGRGWKARALYQVAGWSNRRGDVHYRAVGEHARVTNCAATGLDLARCTVVWRAIGLDAGDVRAQRGAFDLPDGVPLFVDVARRVPEKGLDRLVRAFAKVQTELPDAHLAVAGAPGPADPSIRAAIDETGLDHRVHLLGYRPDARSLMAAADVFVFSSLAEGSPGVVVEALTVGVPVAAFAIPPVVELTDGGRHAWLAGAAHGLAAGRTDGSHGSAAGGRAAAVGSRGSTPDRAAVDGAESRAAGAVGPPEALAEAMLAAYRAPDRAERVAAAQLWAAGFRLEVVAQQLGDLLAARAEGRRRSRDGGRES